MIFLMMASSWRPALRPGFEHQLVLELFSPRCFLNFLAVAEIPHHDLLDLDPFGVQLPVQDNLGGFGPLDPQRLLLEFFGVSSPRLA